MNFSGHSSQYQRPNYQERNWQGVNRSPAHHNQLPSHSSQPNQYSYDGSQLYPMHNSSTFYPSQANEQSASMYGDAMSGMPILPQTAYSQTYGIPSPQATALPHMYDPHSHYHQPPYQSYKKNLPNAKKEFNSCGSTKTESKSSRNILSPYIELLNEWISQSTVFQISDNEKINTLRSVFREKNYPDMFLRSLVGDSDPTKNEDKDMIRHLQLKAIVGVAEDISDDICRTENATITKTLSEKLGVLVKSIMGALGSVSQRDLMVPVLRDIYNSFQKNETLMPNHPRSPLSLLCRLMITGLFNNVQLPPTQHLFSKFEPTFALIFPHILALQDSQQHHRNVAFLSLSRLMEKKETLSILLNDGLGDLKISACVFNLLVSVDEEKVTRFNLCRDIEILKGEYLEKLNVEMVKNLDALQSIYEDGSYRSFDLSFSFSHHPLFSLPQKTALYSRQPSVTKVDAELVSKKLHDYKNKITLNRALTSQEHRNIVGFLDKSKFTDPKLLVQAEELLLHQISRPMSEENGKNLGKYLVASLRNNNQNERTIPLTIHFYEEFLRKFKGSNTQHEKMNTFTILYDFGKRLTGVLYGEPHRESVLNMYTNLTPSEFILAPLLNGLFDTKSEHRKASFNVFERYLSSDKFDDFNKALVQLLTDTRLDIVIFKFFMWMPIFNLGEMNIDFPKTNSRPLQIMIDAMSNRMSESEISKIPSGLVEESLSEKLHTKIEDPVFYTLIDPSSLDSELFSALSDFLITRIEEERSKSIIFKEELTHLYNVALDRPENSGIVKECFINIDSLRIKHIIWDSFDNEKRKLLKPIQL